MKKTKELDLIRDKIQRDASQAWFDKNCKGTIEGSTGIGKNIISFHCAYLLKDNDKEIKTILFLAERIDRKKDLLDDIKNYKTFFNKDLLKDFNIKFSTYQSAYKWKNKEFDLIIGDEIHESLTPAYSQFYFNNKYKYIVGLSATLKDNVDYETKSGEKYTKKDLLNKIAPICYSYNINQAQEDNAARKLKIFIIDHRLDSVKKVIEGGSKNKPFMQTESSAYNYWDDQFRKSLFIPDLEKKKWRITITSKKRADILYQLPSKIEACKVLLNNIKEKTLVFGNSIDPLLKITPYVISSRNDEKKNNKIRSDFEKGKINHAASCKKLEQGANIAHLDALVLISFYGKMRPLIQRMGRIRKSKDKKYGYVFIFKTVNTVEESKWFPKMMENIDAFELISCSNVEDAIEKYQKISKEVS